MKKEEIIKIIEKYAPLPIQAGWDSSGIQVENTKSAFEHVAIMLDPSPMNIEKAKEIQADFILSHHPLSLSPYKLNIHSALFKTVQTLITHNIFLYSAHTSLDSQFNGYSAWIAHDFNLKNLQELDTVNHFGAIGSLEHSLSIDECIQQLLKSMPFINKEDFRLIGQNTQQKIKTIAFCTGSGSELYAFAKKAQADLYITGDVKYHLALDVLAENFSDISFDFSLSSPTPSHSTLLLDVGHFSLEEEMMRRLSEKLTEELTVKVSFISSINPFTTIK